LAQATRQAIGTPDMTQRSRVRHETHHLWHTSLVAHATCGNPPTTLPTKKADACVSTMPSDSRVSHSLVRMGATSRGLDHGGLPWLTGMPHSHGLCRLCAVLLAHPQAHPMHSHALRRLCGILLSCAVSCLGVLLARPQSHPMLCPLCCAILAFTMGMCGCSQVGVCLTQSALPCTLAFFLVIKFGHFKLSASIFLSARSARTHHSCNAPHRVVCQFEIGGCTSCVGLCVGA